MKPHLHVALALIWRDGEVLSARRLPDADHLPGRWEFPGGKVEADETPAQACIREAREEVGVTVEVTQTREAITWDYTERLVTLHPFDCRVIGGEARALASSEIRWCAPHELRMNDFPAANAELIGQLISSS